MTCHIINTQFVVFKTVEAIASGIMYFTDRTCRRGRYDCFNHRRAKLLVTQSLLHHED